MSGEAAAVGCAFCWALSSSMVRGLTEHIPSLTLNSLRSLVATFFYVAIVLITGKYAGWRDFTLPKLAFLAVNLGVGIVLGDTAYYSSMRLVGLSRALTISSIYPLLTAILAGLVLGERFRALTWVGFLLCVGGVVIVARSSLQTGDVGSAARVRRGVLLAIAAAGLWAIGTVSLRAGSVGLDPFLVNGLRLGGVAAVAGTWAARRGELRAVRRLRPGQVALLIAGALVGSLLGAMLYLTAVQAAGASKAAVLASTAPLFSVPMSLLSGEAVNRRLLFGMVAAVVGVMMVV